MSFNMFANNVDPEGQVTILCFIFGNYYELTCCVENSVDPDQLASEKAS